MTEPTTLTAQIAALEKEWMPLYEGDDSAYVKLDAVLSLVRTHEAQQQELWQLAAEHDNQIEAERDALKAEVARLKGRRP